MSIFKVYFSCQSYNDVNKKYIFENIVQLDHHTTQSPICTAMHSNLIRLQDPEPESQDPEADIQVEFSGGWVDVS